MSETLVERMARAMHAACLRHYDGTFKHGNDPLETHRVLALAALRAIREPTHLMGMAPYHPDVHDDHMPAEVVWHAMIDAAIAEAENKSA